MEIRRKFIKAIVILSIVPLLVMTVLYIISFSRYSGNLLNELMTIASDNQSKILEDFISEKISELDTISENYLSRQILDAADDDLGSNEKHEYIRKEYKSLIMKYKMEHFSDNISLVDDSGNIIMSTEPKYIGKNDFITDNEMKKFQDGEYLIGNITKEEIINDGMEYVMLGVPVVYDGEYYGAVIEFIDIKNFNKVISNAHIFSEGNISIYDGHYNLVISDSEDEELFSYNNYNLLEEVKKAEEADRKSGFLNYKRDNRNMVAYYSTVEDNDWIVLLSYDEKQISAPFTRAFNMLLAMLAVIIIGIIISNYKAIKHVSKPVDEFIGTIQKIENGSSSERFRYDKNNELGMIVKSFNKLIDKIEYDNNIIEKYNKELKLMIENIPGGIYTAKIFNQKVESFYVSEHYSKITGCSDKNDNDMESKLIERVHRKDKQRVIEAIRNAVINKEDFDIDYRIIVDDGKIIWVKNKGQIVKLQNEIILYGVVIDITDQKNALESFMISEEKYQIICEHIDDLYFQWNADKDELNVCDEWNKIFKPIECNLRENIAHSKNIYKGDSYAVMEMFSELIYGNKKAECEIRVLANDDAYKWIRIKSTGIYDMENNLKRVIGLISNIDDQKREREKLIFQAQRDGLTKLYNKVNTEKFIDQYINAEGKNSLGTMFIFDLDDFKSINDTKGHIVGDKTLIAVSKCLDEVFDGRSTLGRIGGDEFIAFIKDADYDETYRKAEAVSAKFKNTYIGDDHEEKISVSIGISRYPNDGRNFNELYRSADKALYKAKENGKNIYVIYGDDKVEGNHL